MSDGSEKKLFIIAGPNGAGKTTFALEYLPQVAGCTCFMNDGASPVLVFEQRGSDREIVHDDYYQLLLEEAKR
jgi:predicted ABC-type ATPase